MISRLIKRVIDLLVAATVLVVAAVPMLGIALWIRLTMGSPVLFCQERAGKGKRLALDLRILLLTLVAVLTQKGMMVDVYSTGGLDLDEERSNRRKERAGVESSPC